MRYLNCIWMVLFVLSFAMCAPAAAEDLKQDTEKAGVFTLGEVVVTAEREKLEGAVDRVDEEELRQYNRDDLAEALDLMPGVTVSRRGARNERVVFVRGFDVKHVPLFMDGIPIYVMYDGYSDYGRFTTFDVSQIVLSKGAASVLYGPNTMGGAINVITKRPDKPLEANAGIGMASGETTTAYANFGSNQGNWYVQGGAGYLNRDHFNLSDDFEPTDSEGGGARENSYSRDRKVSFKVGFQPSHKDEYAVSYSKQKAVKGTPPYAGDDPSQKVRYWRWPQWDKESIYFNSKTAIGAKSYVKARLYYDAYDNSLFAYDDDTYSTQNRGSSFRSWYNDDTMGGSLEAGTELFSRNNLKVALHYKRDQHKEHDEGEPERTFKDDYYSVGLEDTVTLTDRWHVVLGASYDRQIAGEAEDYDSDTGVISDFPTQDASAFNPQAGVYYDFSDTGTAYATVARKSRLPSLKDRYSYRMGSALPNPGLDPETSTNYEIGCDTFFDKIIFLDRIAIKGAAFLSDVRDYILTVTIPDPDDSSATLDQNQNVGHVRLYGFEAGLTVRFTDSLNGGISYTCTQWDNRSNSDRITDVPKHKILAHADYTLWEKLRFTACAEHNSGRYSSSDGVRETDSFTIVDIKADYALFNGLKVEVGVNNLFDEDYEVDEGYPEEGASLFANLTYRY